MHLVSRCFRLTNGCWLNRRNDGAQMRCWEVVAALGVGGSQLGVTPENVVAGACFEATKTEVVCFSGDRIRGGTTIPQACGNGHLLTPDNLRVDEVEGR